MSNDAEVRAREVLERWPGYDEQSWSERFAEMDRRYTDLSSKLFKSASFAAEARSRDGEWEAMKERCAKVAEDLPIGGGTLSSWIKSPMDAIRRHIAQAIRSLSAVPLDEGRG